MRGESRRRGEGRSAETSRHNKKGPTRVGPSFVRTGPILTTPGGWGLRNPEPKGPGQRTRIFSQCRAAGARRKSGETMIPANDPVTVCRSWVPQPGGVFEGRSEPVRAPLAAGRGWRNHAIVMIRGTEPVFATAGPASTPQEAF